MIAERQNAAYMRYEEEAKSIRLLCATALAAAEGSASIWGTPRH